MMFATLILDEKLRGDLISVLYRDSAAYYDLRTGKRDELPGFVIRLMQLPAIKHEDELDGYKIELEQVNDVIKTLVANQFVRVAKPILTLKNKVRIYSVDTQCRLVSSRTQLNNQLTESSGFSPFPSQDTLETNNIAAIKLLRELPVITDCGEERSYAVKRSIDETSEYEPHPKR